MSRFHVEAEERRKERDETFCIRMIELSILAATLCGVLITFSYEVSPESLNALLISSSCFIAGGIGFISAILVGRHCEPRLAIVQMSKLITLPIISFFAGLVAFAFGILLMAFTNVFLYVGVLLPSVLVLVGMGFYLLITGEPAK